MKHKSVITRRMAIEAFGGVQNLARALNVSRSAIYMWPEDGPIPEKRDLKIRYELMPDIFGPSAKPSKQVA